MTDDQAKAIKRGDLANRILQDAIFVECMEKLEKDVFEAWARSGVRDKEGQHELFLMIQTARKFKALFESLVATGEIEKNALKAPRLKLLGRFGV